MVLNDMLKSDSIHGELKIVEYSYFVFYNFRKNKTIK